MALPIRDRLPSLHGLRLCVATGLVAIASQIAYPLLDGEARRLITIWSVVAFTAFSCLHSFVLSRVRGVVCLVGVCAGLGLAAEAVGFRTGVPFGNYRYATTLGARVLGVPIVVPFAWAMMGWLALLAARRVFHRGLRVSAYGAMILTAWDLLLDPQMVDAGHWVWERTPGPSLNGIPILNSAGWFGVAFVMLTVLDRLLPVTASQPNPGRMLPAWVMLAWTWFSETLGHLVFFGLPWVALTGGVVFGLVLFPWATRVRADVHSLLQTRPARGLRRIER